MLRLAIPIFSFCLPLSFAAQVARGDVDYNRDVRPILAENCYRCHGPDAAERKAGLQLDMEEAAFAALKSGGHAIVRGDVSKSELIARITASDSSDLMPPPDSGKTLGPAEIETLRRWVKEGATWSEHWSFVAPVRPPLPAVKDVSWIRNPIDRFVLARLETEGLRPSAEADPVTLVRRLHFDLAGVPPTAARADFFCRDAADIGVEREIDRLLDSPQFGERLAVFWLDLVRFADTRGYHSDNTRNVSPYRDYVIESFNRNKPFDVFTIEQLAGDLLENPTLQQKVASGYNKLLQTTEEGGAQPKEYEAKSVADRVRNVSSVWMGATMGCAECHDHKFDPYGTKDFYSLGAFFADLQEASVSDRDTGIPVPNHLEEAQLAEVEPRIATLKKILDTSTPELEKAQASWEQEVVKVTPPRFSPWHLLGPFPAIDQRGGFDGEFGPEKSLKEGKAVDLQASYETKGGMVRWEERTDLVDGQVHSLESRQAVTYIRRIIEVDRDGHMEMLVGTDGGVRVWMNGKKVHQNERPQDVMKQRDKLLLPLKTGENELVIKVVNGAAGYRFFVKHAGGDWVPEKVRGFLSVAVGERDEAARKKVDEPNLAGLWEFEEGSGGIAGDSSLAGNDASLVGGASFVDDADRGNVMSLDGTGWLSTGAFVAELGDADFTCAAWIKTATRGSTFLGKQSDDAIWQIAEKKFYVVDEPFGSGSRPGAIAAVGQGVSWISATGPLVDDDQWHHIAVTFQRDRVGKNPGAIYVDGVPVSEYGNQDYNGNSDNSTDTLYIGRTPGDDGTVDFVGLLDDVAVFSVALNASQVQAVMSGDFILEEEPDIAAYYRSISPLLDDTRQQLEEAEKRKKSLLDNLTRCLISVSGTPRVVRVRPRGNWMDDSGDTVDPAIPAYFGSLDTGDTRATRLDLARWIVSKKNPLGARALVNRLWKLFFGVGLSRGLEDLGAMGEPPVLPGLLDWLAVELVDSGWNLKHMIRLMIQSATYRQSSVASPEMVAHDPFNRLLARQSRWRLDAEFVRDSALAVSGLLTQKVGGRSVRPYQPVGYWVNLNFPARQWVVDHQPECYRRSVYTWWQRSFMHPALMAFDAPSREECTAERARSNIPQQALVLLNDPTYVEAARVLAYGILKEGGTTEMERLRSAFFSTLSRFPEADEVEPLATLLVKHRESYATDPEAARQLLSVGTSSMPQDVDLVELAAWTSVSRAILNLHETVTRN